jgi:tetratricopeptide (TPR) repeat protein
MMGFAAAAVALLVMTLGWILKGPDHRKGRSAGGTPPAATGLLFGVPLAVLALYAALGEPSAITAGRGGAGPADVAAAGAAARAAAWADDGEALARTARAVSTGDGSNAAERSRLPARTSQTSLEATAAALAETTAARRAASSGGPDIEALLARLTRRLQEQPDDASGWLMLAHSTASLGRYPEAVKAYERAARLEPRNAQTLADWADALAMAQDRSARGEPTRLLEAALAIDPNHLKALVMSGSAALERGDREAALRHFEGARQAAPVGSELAQAMVQQVALLRGGDTRTR